MKKILLLFILLTGSLYAQPPIVQPSNLVICDQNSDGFEAFDLTVTIPEILNGLNPSLYSITFYTSLADAQNEMAPIVNPAAYINSSNPQTIFVRVLENANPTNFAITNFDLIVVAEMQFNIDGWNTASCEAPFMPFFLALSGTPNSTVFFTINGGDEQSIVINESGIFQQMLEIVSETSTICFTQIVSNIFPFCSKSLVDIECILTTVFPSPILSQPENLIVYESPFDGIAIFDLTVNESVILSNANIEEIYEVEYFFGNELIQNPTAYQNLNNNSTIKVRVTNLYGCVSEVTFDLIVVEDGIVFIPDVNFKAKLLSSNTTNNIAKNINGDNIVVDVNSDGEIQESEALLVSILYVHSSNVSVVTGLEKFTNLTILSFYENNITVLPLNTLVQLRSLRCDNNQILQLDFNGLLNLESVVCSYNDLQILDFSLNPLMEFLWCGNNPNLEYINIKNGNPFIYPNNDWDSSNPSLQFICVDEGEEVFVNTQIQFMASSYCSFNPGGNYNTITGTIQYDFNNNGCDTSDPNAYYFGLEVNIDGMTTNSSVYSNSLGVYNLFTSNTGVYSLVPNLENDSYFTVTPFSAEVPVMTIDNSTITQNFCISANGVHPDLEVVIAPVIPARPGFEAVYKIVYKNKGNQVMSQNYGLNFFYNHNLMSLVSTSVVPSAQATGGLQWDYANLMPFESRSILVTFLINPPTDTNNPVNIDDVLTFTSVISPQTGDINVIDNTFVFNQSVVGSYDPNDITCLQGDLAPPSSIGGYLHYMIRFENTGNAPAENIVVKTEIDATQYNINSLQMLSASHNATVRRTGNKIEFIFQNIQLDSGGHGNILLKIKSKENLQEGDFVSKMANIYFDYNFPIETNEAETLFAALSINNPEWGASVSVYPNSVNDWVTISSKDKTIKTIELYDIGGRLLQTLFVNDLSVELNMTARSSGIYFLKISTDSGSMIEKVIKN